METIFIILFILGILVWLWGLMIIYTTGGEGSPPTLGYPFFATVTTMIGTPSLAGYFGVHNGLIIVMLIIAGIAVIWTIDHIVTTVGHRKYEKMIRRTTNKDCEGAEL